MTLNGTIMVESIIIVKVTIDKSLTVVTDTTYDGFYCGWEKVAELLVDGMKCCSNPIYCSCSE